MADQTHRNKVAKCQESEGFNTDMDGNIQKKSDWLAKLWNRVLLYTLRAQGRKPWFELRQVSRNDFQIVMNVWLVQVQWNIRLFGIHPKSSSKRDAEAPISPPFSSEDEFWEGLDDDARANWNQIFRLTNREYLLTLGYRRWWKKYKVSQLESW